MADNISSIETGSTVKTGTVTKYYGTTSLIISCGFKPSGLVILVNVNQQQKFDYVSNALFLCGYFDGTTWYEAGGYGTGIDNSINIAARSYSDNITITNTGATITFIYAMNGGSNGTPMRWIAWS